MARLSTYIIDTAVTLLDKIIGTDTASGNATKNFTTESLANLFNQTNKIGVADQATFKFQNNLSPIREVGTISFEVGGGDGTSFSSITTFMLSKKAAGGKTVEQFLQLFVNKNIILAELDAINNFGAYKVSSITTHPTEADFYNVNVTPTSSNGSISDDKYYIFSEFVNPSDDQGDLHFTYTQVSASGSWAITHDLGKNPSVSVVDSGGNTVVGDVVYINKNQLTINFTAQFSGKAYLN